MWPHTSSRALSAEKRTPGLGSRGWPSFRQLSTGGGTAWLWHSRATDSLATTDTFSSSPRMWGGTLWGEGCGQERGHLSWWAGPAAGSSRCQDEARARAAGPLSPRDTPQSRGGRWTVTAALSRVDCTSVEPNLGRHHQGTVGERHADFSVLSLTTASEPTLISKSF